MGDVTLRAIPVGEKSKLPLVSVACAITLTGWSESTFRRRFADGTLERVMEKGGAGRVMVTWASLRPHLAVDWSEVDLPQLLAADVGDPAAQREVALALLAVGYAKGARQWLVVAAKRNDPEAAYWLCRLHLAGDGVEPDPAAAVRWLGEAARLGHAIAQAQIAALSGSGDKVV